MYIYAMTPMSNVPLRRLSVYIQTHINIYTVYVYMLCMLCIYTHTQHTRTHIYTYTQLYVYTAATIYICTINIYILNVYLHIDKCTHIHRSICNYIYAHIFYTL